MITPQITAPNLAKITGLEHGLYLKREDLHPLGSHKGRSIPLMVKKYAASGLRNIVISSSGNAALAAAATVREFNLGGEEPLHLTVFVGKNIDKDKLEAIKKFAGGDKLITVKKISSPKQAAFMAAKDDSVINLRQSTDDTALVGYEELAQELSQIQGLSAVFVPASSGTLAQGLHLGFKNLNIRPEIHIVQTSSCHPFVPSDASIPGESSLARAIVDKVGHRFKEIKKVLSESNGRGWIAENGEIAEAIYEAKKYENIEISPNGALALAGLKKAAQSGCRFSGPVVCLITGK